ncbi:hypothetical protein NKI89_03260 [Mesorhizobium sp. M0309]|uniref:hypothetical protein n=1 Tax=Mesorhizobium sp. M0309 TaxID=2956933 RepID=UPI00333529C6
MNWLARHVEARVKSISFAEGITAAVLIFLGVAAALTFGPSSAVDLKVQQSMATAAWWQVWLSAFGIFALIFTLRLSISADRTATAALTQSEETSRRELRAYLSIAPGGVLRMKRIEPTIIGHALVENVGNVFASDVKLSVHMVVSNDRELAVFPINEATAERIGAVHPRAVVKRGADFGTPPPKLIRGTKTYIYVWGGVWYTDGFDTARFTTFCHRYNAASRLRGGGWTINPDTARFHNYGPNEAD